MNQQNKFGLIWIAVIFLLSGCVARTYQITRDRVDQELPGNRGYVKNKGALPEENPRKTTRTLQVFEIELPSLFKSKNQPKEGVQIETSAQEENVSLDIDKETQVSVEGSQAKEAAKVRTEKYTVQKEDTLQKISKKFYGDSRKWTKIFEANKSILKTPDRVYPGQVLEIPIFASNPKIEKKHKDSVK